MDLNRPMTPEDRRRTRRWAIPLILVGLALVAFSMYLVYG